MNLPLTQPCKQLLYDVFASLRVSHQSLYLNFFRKINNFPEGQATINSWTENFAQKRHNSFFFLYRSHVVTKSWLTMSIFLLFHWKFVFWDQVKQHLILIKNTLFSFIFYKNSAVKSLAQTKEKTKIKHYFTYFPSVIDQNHRLHLLSTCHHWHFLISLIQVISWHHAIVHSTSLSQLSH